MEDKAFLAGLEELFEVDAGSLTMDQGLEDTGKWDSLNFVSFLAMAHSKYGVRVAPADLRASKTVSDLFRLVQPH